MNSTLSAFSRNGTSDYWTSPHTLGAEHRRNVTDTSQTRPESFPELAVILWIWRYCPPFILTVGTFGNVATIVVYQRMKVNPLARAATSTVNSTSGSTTKRVKGSTQHIFLTSLAVSDLCVLYSGLLPDMCYQAFDFDIRSTHTVTCKLIKWLMYVSFDTTAWFLVAMTTQRAMSVTWPHRVSFMFTPRKSRITVAVIVVASCVFQSHQLFGLRVLDSDVYLDGACAAEGGYAEFWYGAWPWMDMSVASLLPCLLLVLSNVVLVQSLRRATRNISRLTSINLAHNRKRVASSMTLTLVLVSFTFLVLTLPVYITMIVYQLLGGVVEDDPALTAMMDLAWAVTAVVGYTNSAINFFLYCVSGSKFRRQFLSCFLATNRSTGSNMNAASCYEGAHEP